MALPTPSPTGSIPVPNGSFEDGATGWNLGTGWSVVDASVAGRPALSGTKFATMALVTDRMHVACFSEEYFPVIPGQSVSFSGSFRIPNKAPWDGGRVSLVWCDKNKQVITVSRPNVVNNTNNQWITSAITASAPAGAAFVLLEFHGTLTTRFSTRYIDVDNLSWNYSFPVQAALTSPNASTYTEDTPVPYRVQLSGVSSSIQVTSVSYYYMTWSDVDDDYISPVLVSTETVAPFAFNGEALPEGKYGAYAVVELSNGSTITTNSVEFVVGEGTPPDVREYRASNSGTYLIIENFSKLAESIPSTALVVGAELEVTYDLELLSRTKDKDIAAENSSTDTVFSVIPQGSINAALLLSKDQVYEIFGTPLSTVVPINRSDFTLEEDMLSEEYRWNTHTLNTPVTAKVGGASSLFGITSMAAQDFVNTSIGLSFVPERGTVPSTAGKGNACVRFKIDSIRLKVYFDAGSVEYYFSSPDGSNVLKGTLVSSNVSSGDLRNGDATGIMQLSPDLEIMDGWSKTILKDYEVHSHYPPTEENKIADVTEDMSYNGLPSYPKVSNNRSRYQFITANFYGDERLNSIYGVNGVDRAFSYNGKHFYKIHTQPEADKDLPRHIAEHHLHLALGYQEGRVDMSVVGEPYNFSGVDGASSWGIGDGVTGLLKLSGTILGVFGSNSISGLSGTTVDNFAVQTISPKMGALEYTVVDMGYPVYANSYGIYTLSQTQQYGDYLGSPLSQDISPWLRPRLVRKDTSDKEVVISWPVRSKNQYRLAFADGYILTMTMNGGQQSAPTFSLQKYFTSEGVVGGEDKYSYPCIVPAAVSSQLDQGGEERIHIANTQSTVVDSNEEEDCLFAVSYEEWGGAGNNSSFYAYYDPNKHSGPEGMQDSPEWIRQAGFAGRDLLLDFYDDGNWVPYNHVTENTWRMADGYDMIYSDGSQDLVKGTIYSWDMSQSVCFYWNIPTGT